MKTKKETVEIINKLKEYYPDATCSLDFSTPFEMMISVMLSAQCTDERVNKTTPSLFAKFNNPESMANADIKGKQGECFEKVLSVNSEETAAETIEEVVANEIKPEKVNEEA